jgi:hypothetical protein
MEPAKHKRTANDPWSFVRPRTAAMTGIGVIAAQRLIRAILAHPWARWQIRQSIALSYSL